MAKKVLYFWILTSLSLFLLGHFIFPTSSKQNTFFYLAVCLPSILTILPVIRTIDFKNIFTLSLFILIFYLFINSLWSIHYTTEQSLKYFRHAVTLFALFFSLHYINVNNKKYTLFIFNALLAAAFFHALFYIHDHFTRYNNPLSIRFGHDYYNPIDAAIYAGIPLLLCVYFLIQSKKPLDNLIYFSLSIPFLLIILLSKSRGVQISITASILFLSIITNIDYKKILLYFLSFVACGIAILSFTDSNLGQLFDRGLKIPYRPEIWATSFKESIQYFWFGQGASHRPPLTLSNGMVFHHSHNTLLAVFRMGGILGAVIFLSNLFLTFYWGLKYLSDVEKLWLVWLFFGILCLMTNGQYPLTRPTSLWFAYWIPVFFICSLVNIRLKDNRRS
jgi:hypothetical protein